MKMCSVLVLLMFTLVPEARSAEVTQFNCVEFDQTTGSIGDRTLVVRLNGAESPSFKDEIRLALSDGQLTTDVTFIRKMTDHYRWGYADVYSLQLTTRHHGSGGINFRVEHEGPKVQVDGTFGYTVRAIFGSLNVSIHEQSPHERFTVICNP